MRFKFILLLALCLLITSSLFAQTPVMVYGPLHTKPLTITVQVESGNQTGLNMDSVVIAFPRKLPRGGGAWIDSLADASGAGEAVSDIWTQRDIAAEVVWSGYLEIDIILTNVDLGATDSLQIKAYAIDYDGNVVTNDVVYLDFGTPPSYSVAAVVKSWTTAVMYRASLTGAFGLGTYGVLLEINVNDVTASKTGSLVIKPHIR